MYGFWALAIVIGLIHRCTKVLNARRHAKSHYRAATSSLRLWVKRRLLTPATFSRHCQDPIGWYTIPPRLETVLLIAYLIVNFVFLFPGYDLFEGNLWYVRLGPWILPPHTNVSCRYPTYQLQISRYLAIRAGLLAIAQLPVVWVSAQRNDPLLWITGWSFTTYNRFHRWVARLCLVLAIVHSSSYSIYTWHAGPGLYAASWMQEYWYCGGIVSRCPKRKGSLLLTFTDCRDDVLDGRNLDLFLPR